MSIRRDIRRLAMQLLYQIDQRGEGDIPSIVESLTDDDEAFDDEQTRSQAVALAEAAWAGRHEADALATELAPDWPTHRQPPVDRAILRIAYHEIKTARAPVKVAINEAVELAKQYGAQSSPPFINGVLDKLARRLSQSSPEAP